MCESWCDYLKPKYGEKAEVCYMDTDSSLFFIKIEGICVNITKDIETRFDTPNYALGRPLLKEKK